MDEAATMKRAKEYMDKLAQGIDPISGAGVPEDSVLNQERLSRCFTYVSGVLQDVIKRELVRKRCIGLRSSLLTPEVMDRMSCSTEPLLIRPLVERINSLWDSETVKEITVAMVIDWLVWEGFMESKDGTDRQVTKQGEAIGLSASELIGKEGVPYMSAVCSEAAQHFLLDHLDEIIAYAQVSWELFRRCLTPELLNRIPCSAEPLGISQLMERINGVLEPVGGKKLTVTMVTNWLLCEGFLEKLSKRAGRYPTQRGREIGLLMEKRSAEGHSGKVLYNEAAQRFVVDHLDQIIADEKLSMKKKRTANLENLLDPDGLKQFPCSAIPLSVWQLMERINALWDPDTTETVPSAVVMDWLFQKGFTEAGTRPNGARIRMPTKQGETIGLSVCQKDDKMFILFKEEAQHFVLDHLDQMLLSYYAK